LTAPYLWHFRAVVHSQFPHQLVEVAVTEATWRVQIRVREHLMLDMADVASCGLPPLLPVGVVVNKLLLLLLLPLYHTICKSQ